MYARVARWEGAEADRSAPRRRASTRTRLRARPRACRPRGCCCSSIPTAAAPWPSASSTTEEDLRKGDETLNAMSPPGDGMGQRTSVEMYEVAADLRM